MAAEAGRAQVGGRQTVRRAVGRSRAGEQVRPIKVWFHPGSTRRAAGWREDLLDGCDGCRANGVQD